jgi:hypothetical protein
MGREADAAGGLEAPGDSLSSWRDVLRNHIKSSSVPLNELPSYTAKQAAFSLERLGEVKIVERGETLVVERKLLSLRAFVGG